MPPLGYFSAADFFARKQCKKCQLLLLGHLAHLRLKVCPTFHLAKTFSGPSPYHKFSRKHAEQLGFFEK